MGIFEKIEEHTEIIAKKTGLNGKLVFYGLIVATFFVLIGVLEKYITMTLGVLLPAHFSLKALETKEGDDDKQWLTYWTVFSIFVIGELFCGSLLSYIPFYFFLKLVFLIWLFLPNFQGASVIYDHFLAKFFKGVEKDIDETIGKITKKSK